MMIEILQPELEALIQRRMESGHFATAEDVLHQALQTSPEPDVQQTAKMSLGQFLRESPFWGSGIETERMKDLPRPVEL
jgi:Arc/MetJ-type ribon-helix-helix transcriptional regulator